MFYENDRIIRKQQKFINTKAVAMIDNFKNKGLEPEEIYAALDILLGDNSCPEFDKSIASRAIKILQTKEDHEGRS